MITVLYPRDILEVSKVDAHFRAEADMVLGLGMSIHLMDHDALVSGDLSNVLKKRPVGSVVVYRGWMVDVSQYRSLYELVQAEGVTMLTSPESYAQTHYMPHWVGKASGLTADTKWTLDDNIEEFVSTVKLTGYGQAVIKDWVKSEKDYWDTAMYIPDTDDTDAVRSVVETFRQLRGTLFDTGFVVRRYETYEENEIRTWWVNGKCVLHSPHPDSSLFEYAFDSSSYEPLVESVGSPFCTVDFVKHNDDWRIIEMGDGQVSGYHEGISATKFAAWVLGEIGT